MFVYYCFFFFFQAEDGIRDRLVTGFQTCALPILGSRNFIIFYILCGIGAAMAHVLMDTHSQIPVIGASGAISGVLGAYIINHPKARILVLIPFFFIIIIKIRALYVLGYWFVLQFINSYTVSSQGGGVAYAAHIGGFVSGMILILFFNKKTKKIGSAHV